MAGDVFPFVMHPQVETNWCWAATCASVAMYYQGNVLPPCELVESVFGLSNCCEFGSSAACNRPESVLVGLRKVNHFDRLEIGPATAIESAIAARRPIATAILWPDGTGHAPVINGFGDIVVSLDPFVLERYLNIQDPLYGPSFISFDSFRNYRGGRWVRTYYTKP
jgi:hypothetical protein